VCPRVHPGRGRRAGLGYTIGLTDHGHPELVATDTGPELAELTLAHLAERDVAGERFDRATSARCTFEPGLGLTVGFLDVDPAQVERGLVNLCVTYYDIAGGGGSPGLEPRARQVVLPDEYCCHEHERSQPLLDTADDVLATVRGPNRATPRTERRRTRRRRHHDRDARP
jgi:hypothetical protein